MRITLNSALTALIILGAGDYLLAADVLTRDWAFLLALLAIMFILKSPLPEALTFAIASIPLSPALPIPGFDTFALWRIIISVLALRFLVTEQSLLKRSFNIHTFFKSLYLYEFIGLLFLVAAALSLVAATDLVVGFRKLIFLLNALVLYIVLRYMLQKEVRGELRSAVKRGLVLSITFLLLIGIAQYISVAFVSLYDFWQGWALDVIPVFYGDELGNVLSGSNTWFSYYEESPPTLRMFSLLPDSHSFGIIMLMAYLFLTVLLVQRKNRKKELFLLTLFTGLAVFFNGSRGIWLSAVVVTLLSACILLYTKQRRQLYAVGAARAAFITFVALALIFPIASSVIAQTHGTGIDEEVETAAFKRAKSIFDLEEASNKGRLGIWKANLQSVSEHPFLGLGFGNSALALDEDIGASRRGASAHNFYLDSAVETGVLGGLASIVFFLTLAGALFRKFMKAAPNQAPFLLNIMLMTIWIGLYNLFDVVIFNDRALLFFFALIALAVTQPLREKTDPV